MVAKKSSPIRGGSKSSRHGMVGYKAAKLGSHHSRGGWRGDLQLYLRSSLEADFARLLNFLAGKGQIQQWEYESHTWTFTNPAFGYKRGPWAYTNDFRVAYRDQQVIYYEIKGRETGSDRTKARRMRKHFPGVRIVRIDKKEFNRMVRPYRRAIPNLET